MKVNDPNDEDYGKDIPESREMQGPVAIVTLIFLACIAVIIMAATFRIAKWILQS